MRKVIIGSVLVVIGFGMSGCIPVNVGNDSITKKENVNRLIVHKTTKAQTKQILGEPANIMLLDGGKERWTYQNTRGNAHLFTAAFGALGRGNSVDAVTTIVTLTFNAKGILINKKYGY